MDQSKIIEIVPVTQNVDRAITRKAYEQFGHDLLVTSFFRTIQGEGPYTGYPSVFLRLAGCNYGAKDAFCAFCDTSFQFDQGKQYSTDALINALVSLPGYNPKDILVITGGEPTLQIALLGFMLTARHYFAGVQIETNGTQVAFFTEMVERGFYPEAHDWLTVVVSPKASYKADRYPKLHTHVLMAATCLKFVIDAEPESPHHTVPEDILEFAQTSSKKVYVSPMAIYKKPYAGEVSSIWDADLIDHKATSRNYAYAAEYAMRHNLLLSLQTHLFLGVA